MYLIEMKLRRGNRWFPVKEGILSEQEAIKATENMRRSACKAIYLYREMTHEEINAYKRVLRKEARKNAE